MYDPKSKKAEEFINHEEILDTLAYADAHKDDAALIDEIIAKARLKKGLSHREASVLLACTLEDKNQEVYELAREIKRDFYGDRIVMFAPLYLSNYCVNGCLYCPYPRQEPPHSRKKLTQDEIRAEVIALQDMGHKRLALEAGEDPVHNPLEYILVSIQTIYSIQHKNGAIRRVNVNIAATTVENYRKLKEAGIGTYILFQETYHKESYEHLHPTGPKSNYAYHTEAHDRAMEGGIDDVGLAFSSAWSSTATSSRPADARGAPGGRLRRRSPHHQRPPGLPPPTTSTPANSTTASPTRPLRRSWPASAWAVPYTGMIISTRESQKVRERVLELGISQISGGSRDQRRRLRRGGARGGELGPVRRGRPPHPGSGGQMAHGPGLRAVLLHRLLPGGPHRRPVHVPVQAGQIHNCWPAQRPDDPQGVSGGLRLSGDQGHRREGHRRAAPEHPNLKARSVVEQHLREIEQGQRDFRF